MGKMPTLEDMKMKYDTKPTESRITEIDDTSYTVISHYIGGKDIDEVIRTLAKRQAYEDMTARREK